MHLEKTGLIKKIEKQKKVNKSNYKIKLFNKNFNLKIKSKQKEEKIIFIIKVCSVFYSKKRFSFFSV